ncbi:hypothetical protein HdK5_00030 [Escherichia phage vB_EcoM_HdK5]|uniref:Uncharacterized protein n=1 Tax=Escherichia phage vB_EcoM_HdK5 TaxID=2508197 RepID=A0A482MWH0_9CAUD|nr:hypothetical protein HdK5_00030 [Escherichia phage vB_EcoM_HdK5]
MDRKLKWIFQSRRDKLNNSFYRLHHIPGHHYRFPTHANLPLLELPPLTLDLLW